MESILTLNQSVFGTKTKERSMSRRSRRAIVQELYTPVDADEITYDEGYDIDGGGIFTALVTTARITGIVANAILILNKLGMINVSETVVNICKATAVVCSIASTFGYIGGVSTAITKFVAKNYALMFKL